MVPVSNRVSSKSFMNRSEIPAEVFYCVCDPSPAMRVGIDFHAATLDPAPHFATPGFPLDADLLVVFDRVS